MAYIKQNQQTKKWEFFFDYYDEYGKRKQVRKRGFKSKKEATDVMSELLNEVNQGDFVESNDTTVGEFIEHWLTNERKMQCSEPTYQSNKSFFNHHIKPKLGQIKLQKLNPFICQKFIGDLHNEGYSTNTILRISSVLKLSLDRAVAYKLIKENYMRSTKAPKRQKKEMKVWSVDQINNFLNTAKGSTYFVVYAIAILTGMRQAEILGLHWDEVDFAKKIITVNKSLTRCNGQIKSGSKTISSERRVSIPTRLISILKEHRKYYLELKLKLGNKFEDNGLVNFTNSGKPMNGSNVTRAFKQDAENAGLPIIRFHDLRHSHATMLIQEDVNAKIISERLGHSSISITLDVYSHVLPSMQKAVADKLDEIIAL